MEKIYRVTTEGDCEGKSTREIAYAKGNQKDILRFYDSEKMYGIYLQEIFIKNITPEGKVAIRNAIQQLNYLTSVYNATQIYKSDLEKLTHLDTDVLVSRVLRPLPSKRWIFWSRLNSKMGISC